MDRQNDSDHLVRRIVLPSGRKIEVVRPADPPAPPSGDSAPGADPVEAALEATGPSTGPETDASTESPTPSNDEPHLCSACGSSLVYPVAWSAADAERWSVELRCPNCERIEISLLELDVAERFDEDLERGAESLMSDLAHLTEANMVASLERFVAALRADAIVPMDF